MIFYWKKQKKAPAEAYDHSALEPVIRSSICTGEKVTGFREGALIRTPADLEAFKRKYGIDGEIPTIY